MAMEGNKVRYMSVREFMKSHYFFFVLLLFSLSIALYFMEALQGIQFIIFLGVVFLGYGLIAFESKIKALILAVGVIGIFGTFMLATGLSLNAGDITQAPDFFNGLTQLRSTYIPIYSEIQLAISGDPNVQGIWVWVDLIKTIVPFFLVIAGAFFAMSGSWGKVLSCIIACIVLVLMNTILGAGGMETLQLGVTRMPYGMLSVIEGMSEGQFAGNSWAIGFIGFGLYMLLLLPFFGLTAGLWYWKYKKA